MVSLTALKKCCQEGLVYLRRARGVVEAEVFASSNGNFICRLNYTSHIPSNGVEEPKSVEGCGVGVRVVFKTPEGNRIGVGSEPNDLSGEGVKKAVEKARKAAVRDPDFKSLPQPTGEKRTLIRYHDPKLTDLSGEHLVAAGWKVVNGALKTFLTSRKLAILAGGRGNIASLGLIVGGDVTVLQERIAIASSSMPQVQTDESTLIMSFVTAMVEGKNSKGSGCSAGIRFSRLTGEAGVQAARSAIESMGGQRIQDGEYTVILGRQPVTDLLNHIIIPSLRADAFYASDTAFLGRVGKKVASDILLIYDDGAAPGLMGSKGITCEGLPTGRTDLMRDGIVVGLLSNYYSTQQILSDERGKEKLGVDPKDFMAGLVPRNGFRFTAGGGRHFQIPPMISATNVRIEGRKPQTRNQLIKQVRDGIYIGRIWYTYPINGLVAGDFTCTIVGDSYLIKDGKIAAPLKPNTVRINDNINNILQNIIGITKESAGTIVWAADEVAYAPEIAVQGVRLQEIAGYTETL